MMAEPTAIVQSLSVNSLEYEALRKNYLDLTNVVSIGRIPGALFQEGLVDNSSLGLSGSIMSPMEIGDKIMKQVLQSIMVKPKLFESFCKALEVEPTTTDVLAALKGTYKSLVQEQRSIVPPATSEEREAYRQIKYELEVFQKAFHSASSNDSKDSALTLIKDRVEQFIEISLNNGFVEKEVKLEIDALCHKAVAVPSILWDWVKEKFEEISHRQLEQKPASKANTCVNRYNDDQELFTKDAVYHAGLCCEAVHSCSKATDVKIFFQNKSPRHNLEMISLTQSDNVRPFLIAKQANTIYVAFRSEPLLSNWKKAGYDEGLKKQASQIPTHFFTELLWTNHKVILTGFSFGGMLACCVMANLWQESQICAEVLLKQSMCITFGQPFMKIKLVDQALKMCPDLKKSIHSVFLKEDLFPQIMGYVSLAQHREQMDIPQAPDGTRQGGTSTMLASVKRVRIMTESLLKLQEVFLQRGKAYTDAASPDLRTRQSTVKDVENLKDQMENAPESPEDIVCLVYGSCYVMSIDPKEPDSGIVWEPSLSTMPKFLALQLTFNIRALVKKIVDVKDNLFKKHTMDHYNHMILRSYLDKPEKYTKPKGEFSHSEVKMLIPEIKRVELHEYPKEHVLVLEGDNLWFSFKIVIDEGGPHHCEIKNPYNITKRSLQFNFKPLLDVSSAIQNEKRVKLTLHTHFVTKVQRSVECQKEPFPFSVRQIQLAKHTPSQVIKLAYLSALLEQQQGKANGTKRYLKVTCFLEEAVKVVPVESVLNAIAYARHDIALECAKALKASKLTLQPTKLMFLGILQALFRAMCGISGEDLKNTDPNDPVRATSTFTIGQLHMGAFGNIPSTRQPAKQNTAQSQQGNASHGQASPLVTPTRTLKSKYAEVLSGKSPAEVLSSLQLQRYDPYLYPALAIQIPDLPNIKVFPDEIIEYLNTCRIDLEKRAINLGLGRLDVVSKTNLEEVYPTSATIRRNLYFTSPRRVLAKAMDDLSHFINKAVTEMSLASPPKHPSNKAMLKLLNKIYNFDITLCAALLGAFMEQCIHIPFLKSPEVTAKALSSPIAVGVWALFTVNRESLQKTLDSSKKSEVVVKVKEYMRSVLCEQEEENADREEAMYAGKLQFLLQGMHRTVTSSTKYISYSLEHQLCNNLKFRKDESVHDLVSKWDKIFKDDVLSLVAESHRPLLARWLKWTVLVHDLREVLAEYTCIGVTGLINSGKSLLVKKLFNIKKVQVGTLKSKHTTVPLLYNLEVDGLDVIDFPGLDDNDESVPELAQLMLTLSQIIIFVVDYKRISASAIKLWLDKMKTDDVPVLVCLTYADNLYLECVTREEEYNMKTVEFKKQAIKIELQHIQDQIGVHPSWEVDFFSFARVPTVTRENLEEVGIKSQHDVGKWIVSTLKNKLDQGDMAQKLEELFNTGDFNPCLSQ